MNNDKKLILFEANSRKAKTWAAKEYYWSELVERLKTPARGTETLDVYRHMPKAQQDNLKDVGGFVAGILKGGHRKASAVTGRSILTLDLDHIPAEGTEDILRRVEGLGCAYCVYSTRKHVPAAPRLRVLLPLDRLSTADEYEPLARKAAEMIGIEYCDPSTFEASRLMYWPSCCVDSQYVYTFGDKPFLSADGMLKLYKNWKDVSSWPQVPGSPDPHKRQAAKQGDPTAKKGLVGAFCRTYDIYAAIDKYLPEAYTPTDIPNRYTYTGGSTTGGAIIYDNGAFLYSHHATDPCSGQLVNAFDLVRLHRFGDLDDEGKPDATTTTTPSYKAMIELAAEDKKVVGCLQKERYEEATRDFTDVEQAESPEPEKDEWLSKLKRNTNGVPLKTIKNIRLYLAYDPLLKNRIRLDTFADQIVGEAPLPWYFRQKSEGPFAWTDADDAGIRDYIQQVLDIKGKDLVYDATCLTARAQAYNPVEEFIKSAKWDGEPRLDTLYIDYLGADDSDYTRAVTRKAFVAAVARALEPGTKFDYMTVLEGPQGIGKTTLYEKMGSQWFNNSLISFDGKEAAEVIQGSWIIEIGELGAYSKSDIRQVKQFLSKREDTYRAAYGRRTESHPRRCIFFGTTNNAEYLRDPTGNRRFWPVEVTGENLKYDIFTDLTADVIAQIWAEAYVRYQQGEVLILSKELEAEAENRRAEHTERDPLMGQVEAFLEKPVPENWNDWNATRRSLYWENGITEKVKTVPRDRVCVSEIWYECLGGRYAPTQGDSRRITNILDSLPNWERGGTQRFGCLYGQQRAFKPKKIDRKTLDLSKKWSVINLSNKTNSVDRV